MHTNVTKLNDYCFEFCEEMIEIKGITKKEANQKINDEIKKMNNM